MSTTEYARFNDCKHTGITIGDETETISIRYGNGRQLTVCFIPFENGGTIDIQRHDTDLLKPRDDRGETEHWPIIGFCRKTNDKGQVIMGRCDVRETISLLTLPYDD